MFISTILEMVGLGFIFSIVGVLNPTTIKDSILINKLSTFLELSETKIILYLLLAFLIFYIFKIIFLTFYSWFESNFLYTYKEYLSSKVFKEYLNQNFSFFYNRNSSELIRNLMTEVDLSITYLISFLKLALEIVVAIGIFFLLAYVDLYFAISITIIFLFISVIYFFSIREKLNVWGMQRQSNIKKKIQFMQEGLGGIKIIKLLGRENFFFNKFKIHNINLNQVAMKAHFFSNIPRLFIELVGIFILTFALVILYYSGRSIIEITQILTVYVAASFRIFPSITRIISSLQFMKLSNPAINVLHDELKNFKKETQISYEKFSFNKKIFIDIKKFTYPNSNNFEISDIRLDILKGQKIGIIGPSGSGKSTVVEILAGISEEPKGSITVDGKSIFSNIGGWQKLIGFVPQKIFILDESLRNNILFGLDNKKYTDDQIMLLIKKISL